MHTARRLLERPVIHEGLGPLGGNINGPSLIRVPDWAENRLGRYYLYFAHHKGRSIRMAYADQLTGPWTLHEPGVLDVRNSLFLAEDMDPSAAGTGTGDWAAKTGGAFLYAHVASPDVLVDHGNRRFLMYYHGLLADSEQKTRLSVSPDGLDFKPLEPLLGPPYFRVFSYLDAWYAVAWGGALFRADQPEGPFERGPDIFMQPPFSGEGTNIRHVAVLCSDDRLELWFSRIGDCPERILYSSVSLGPDWRGWKAGPVSDVLAPELDWEGAGLAQAPSSIGAADDPENGLRDPFVFAEDGRRFLLYSGAGEQNIGLAELD
jgi:hypothetical protein